MGTKILKIVPEIRELSDMERIAAIDLLMLEERRKIGDMITTQISESM